MSVNVTLTFPESIINKIDKERGLINRSKFVVQLLEKAYENEEETKAR